MGLCRSWLWITMQGEVFEKLWSPDGVYQACCSSVPTGCAITSCLGLPGSDPCWAEKVSAKGICALASSEAAEVY